MVSSRTPEGFPSHCLLCGAASNLEFADPAGDAPCPNCGHLLWKSAQLLQQFRHALSEQLSIPARDISPQTSLADYRADSLDVVELVMEFEDEFSMTIPDADYDRIRTIGDAVRYMERRLTSPDR